MEEVSSKPGDGRVPGPPLSKWEGEPLSENIFSNKTNFN